jgi:Protein of unknown function (DUF2380)
MTNRRQLLVSCLCASAAARAADAPEPIAVIGFDLVDEQPDPAREAALQRRLAALHAQLEQGLRERGLYRVLDTAPARELIETIRARNAFVYRCNGCFGEVAQRLGTRLVAVGWVQRVSELILNINVSVRDAITDNQVLVKSVDLRGNNDESFTRAMAFMLRDWSERRALDPRYGL